MKLTTNTQVSVDGVVQGSKLAAAGTSKRSPGFGVLGLSMSFQPWGRSN
jgi:hypothetical protein